MTGRALVLVAIGGALYLVARTTGSGWLVVILAGLVALATIGALWPGLSLRRVRVVIDAPRDATAGRAITVAVEVAGRSPGVQVRLVTPESAWVHVDAPGGGDVRAVLARRGVHADVAIELRSAAPLGLVTWRRRGRIGLDRALEVGPERRSIRWRQPGTTAPGTEVRAGSAVAALGDAVRGVREHRSGDSLRIVHWPASARRGALVVKELEPPAAPGAVLVVDLRGTDSEVEAIASRAAALADAALDAGATVHLCTREPAGPRHGPVTSPLEVGRRLARAIPGAPAPPPPGLTDHVTYVMSAADPADGSPTWRPSERPRAGYPGEQRARRWSRQTSRPESGIALRVAVLVAVMAGALAVLDQGVGGPGLAGVVMIGLPLAYATSYATRRRNRFWLKVGLAAGLLLAFGVFLASVSRAFAVSLADVQVPLAELFIWVQLLHALDTPARRDLMFSLASSLTLVGVAGVLSISLGFAPYVVVWSLAAVAALVLAHRSELDALTRLGARPRATARSLALARSVLSSVLLTVVVGTAVFLVVPAAGSARALTFPARLPESVGVPAPGGLANPSLGSGDPSRPDGPDNGDASDRASFGYFGFSRTLDTGVRGRPDDTLVMRVRASHPDFWRGQVFDAFDGRTWSVTDDTERAVRGSTPLRVPATPEQPIPLDGSELVQTFYVERPGPNVVFGAYAVDELYFPDDVVFQLADGTLRAGVQLEEGAVYTVVSRRPPATEAGLRAASGVVPIAIRDRYTSTNGVTPRVAALAEEVAGAAPTVYDQVRALEAWIAEHTRYSLDAPPLAPDANAVEQFLFEDRVGFCEQIGSSLVVMLRALGVPARLVVGYLPGERNPLTGLYEVRADDAHSWAEVYVPGVGWQGFDPTASVPLAGDGGLATAGAGLVGFLRTHVSLPAWAPEAAALAGLGAFGAWVLFRLARRHISRARAHSRSWADAQLARLEALGSGRGRARSPAETVPEYVAALVAGPVPDPGLAVVAATLEREAFSGAPPDLAARHEASAILTGAAGG